MEAGGKRRRGFLGWFPWRGLLLLALLVTLVRIFFCTVLRVPTGSMEPTLHGDANRGDELLVLKPLYRLFKPSRFDLVVFERTGNDVKSEERVAVKRVVGLGGEGVRIEAGDLWITPERGEERRWVKPYREFRPLLVPLWKEPFDASCDTRLQSRDPRTTWSRGGVTLVAEEEDGEPISLDLGADAARFDGGWVDDRGNRQDGDASVLVKDLLFELEAELSGPNLILTFEFTISHDVLKFTLIPTAPGHSIEFARIPDVGAPLEDSSRFRQISPDKKHKLEFWQIDGNVGFAVDGRVELDTPLPGGSRAVLLGALVRDVRLSVSHGRLKLTKLNVWRDLHWTSDGEHGTGDAAYEVPEGEYFVLGDHSGASIDSRHFGSVALTDFVGAPLMITGPSSRFRWLR